MSSLSQLLSHPLHHPAFTLPANWLQGRTAYGGLTAALALQAAINQHHRVATPLPPLQAAQISFIAPMAGALRFESTLLRQGKSAVSVSVDGFADDKIGLRASFIFAQPRPSAIAHQRTPMPQVEPPEAYPETQERAQAPVFLSNFDVRYIGNTPVCAAQTPDLLAWVRFGDSVADVHPAVALLAMGDCLAPAAMASFTEFAPASSMNWTLHFAQVAQPDEWFLLQSQSLHAAHGYAYQTMQVWNAQGQPLLLGSQTVAVFA